MSVFDFSERHATISRRLTSNTPLQALVLMDDPQSGAYACSQRACLRKSERTAKSNWCSVYDSAFSN